MRHNIALILCDFEWFSWIVSRRHNHYMFPACKTFTIFVVEIERRIKKQTIEKYKVASNKQRKIQQKSLSKKEKNSRHHKLASITPQIRTAKYLIDIDLIIFPHHCTLWLVYCQWLYLSHQLMHFTNPIQSANFVYFLWATLFFLASFWSFPFQTIQFMCDHNSLFPSLSLSLNKSMNHWLCIIADWFPSETASVLIMEFI